MLESSPNLVRKINSRPHATFDSKYYIFPYHFFKNFIKFHIIYHVTNVCQDCTTKTIYLLKNMIWHWNVFITLNDKGKNVNLVVIISGLCWRYISNIHQSTNWKNPCSCKTRAWQHDSPANEYDVDKAVYDCNILKCIHYFKW